MAGPGNARKRPGPDLDAPHRGGGGGRPAAVTLRKEGHSREEFAFAAYLLHALVDAPVDAPMDAPVDPEAILEAVREGHRHGLVDVAIVLDDEQVVLADWDGGLWHDAARLEADVRKTRRMLEEENAIVVRVRVNSAVAFPEVEGAIVVRSARGHPAKAVQSLVSPLTTRVSVETAERLRQRATGARVAAVDAAVDAAWGTLDSSYAETLKELEAFVGSDELAKRLAANGGVKSRPEAVRHMATWLCREVGMRIEDVVRMDDCFWALCDAPEVVMAIIEDLRAKGLDTNRLASMSDCFWHAAVKHPVALAAAVANLEAKGLDTNHLASMGNCFWHAAVKHPVALAAAVADLEAKGLDTNHLASMGDSFWSAVVKHPVALAAAIADLEAKGLDTNRLASMGDCFWHAAVKHPVALAAAVADLEAKGLDTNHVASMGGSFWHAAVKHPVALAAAIADLEAKGLDTNRIASMGSSFWHAVVQHPVALAAAVADLEAKGLETNRLASMGNCFWHASVKHPVDLATSMALLTKLGTTDAQLPKFDGTFWAAMPWHNEVLTLLTQDYGMRASNLHLLRSFWSTLKSQPDVDALRAELAALPTSGAVTKRLRFKNNDVPIGDGARWCAHARPKLTPSVVGPPKATTQSSLTAFFAKR